MVPSYLFPRYASPASYSPSLLKFLASKPSEDDLVPALEEFAWRSLTEGSTVRKYCNEISSLIARVTLKTSALIQSALRAPSIAALFPLIIFNPHPEGPGAVQTVPPQLLSASSLLNLSKKQVIDVLTKTSQERTDVEGEAQSIREQVLELCLEYVGKRWRGGEGKDERLVDSIARKLTGIEFEIQLHGHPLTIRSLFLPIIHSMRFSLGMVSASQLSTRLNNISNQVVRTHVSFEPDQLITSWLVARLRAGVEPQVLVDELVTVREKLRVDADKDALSGVLRSFGLLGRGRTMNDASVLCQPGLASPVTTVVLPETPAPPAESLSVYPSVCRNVSPSSVTGRWWSHRRNNSSTSRPHNLASLINSDRQPSLPVLSSPGLISTVSYRPINLMGTYHNSSSSLANRNPSTPRHSNLTQREVSSMDELLASLMALDNPEDIRFILLDHLLMMRYSLHSEQCEDWFLGEGRFGADETLTGIEIRLVSRKDDVSLRGILVDLRDLFGLPDSTTIAGSAYTAKHHSSNQVVQHSSVLLPRPSLASYASEMPKPSSSLHEEDGKSEASFSVCGREVYFDLDDYISDMSPNVYSPTCVKSTVPVGSDSSSGVTQLKRAADRKSTGAESQRTTGTLLTDFSPCRASFLSAYTIREATHGYATESVGTQVSLPPRTTSMTDLQAAYISKPTSSPDGSSDLERFWHLNIGTRSEPELLELLDALAINAGHSLSSHGHDGDVKNSQLSSVCLRQMARLRDRPALGPPVQELGSTYARTRSPSITPHNPTLDPSGEYHSTQIAIPTVPFVPRLAYIPSIPSISSGEGATTNVNKNLAGLDTPPASPPIPDGSVIPNCLLGLAAETTSPMKTSLDEGSRNFNRQLAIFDGTHVSPPREMPISVCGDDSKSKYTTPISELSPNVNEDDPVGTGVSGPKTRSVSQQAAGLGDLKPLPQLPSSDAEERAVSLLDVIVLFDITNGEPQPRAGLQHDEVSSVLRKIVNSSSGEEARAEWLLSQMESLLGGQYGPLVRYYLDILTPPSIVTSSVLQRPSPLRRDAYLYAYTVTPPPGSPLSLCPESVDAVSS